MSDPVLGANVASIGVSSRLESMPWQTRRWTSVVVSLVLTPLALGLAMIGGYRQVSDAARFGTSYVGIILLLLGALLLLVVAAAGRVAGIGPLVAGVAYGGFGLISLFSDDMLWELTNLMGSRTLQYGVFSYSGIMLPIVGALLIGAGLSGRWGQDTGGARSASPGAIVEL